MRESLSHLSPQPDAASRPPLLIVGSSVRAAAFSALRAGYLPLCCDQFGDADLQAVAQTRRIECWPDDLLQCCAEYPGVPLVYTGGVEGHPELVERLAEGRLLLGNFAATLQRVRDPLLVTEALRSSRLPTLEVREASVPPPADGSWLLKPLRSAGGRGIVPWTPEAAESATLRVPHYFQQRASGRNCSAVFIAREGVGDVRFVGVTEQLIGEPFCNGSEFAWCGNLGPIALPVQVESLVRRLANFLKWKFELRGLFGLDFVVGEDDSVGLTEINPRYPASVELLEFSTGGCLMLDHCCCFSGAPGETPEVDWTPLSGRVLGKAILYSTSKVALQFNREFLPEHYRSWQRFLDVPSAGTVIQGGDPVCTVTASGQTPAVCREALRQQAEAILGTRA